MLTDESEGETPMIPATLMQYSISQSEKVDMQTTLKVLASPGNEAHTILGSDSMDTVIRSVKDRAWSYNDIQPVLLKTSQGCESLNPQIVTDLYQKRTHCNLYLASV